MFVFMLGPLQLRQPFGNFLISWIFGPRFQTWDLRTCPQAGNFTQNPIFRSKIASFSVQRPKIRKIDLRNFEINLLVVYVCILGILDVSRQQNVQFLMRNPNLTLKLQIFRARRDKLEKTNLRKIRKTNLKPKFSIFLFFLISRGGFLLTP